MRFKFGTDIEDRPLQRANRKMTPKWAWPGSRDPISKCWDPVISFEVIEQSASNLVQTYWTPPPLAYGLYNEPKVGVARVT